ncbi:MAG TPA: hypothetical protein VG711_08025, partial [Phycisphaerales bacterium]|nr:hypothetical protein [Phycisphaerales bacterium]
ESVAWLTGIGCAAGVPYCMYRTFVAGVPPSHRAIGIVSAGFFSVVALAVESYAGLFWFLWLVTKFYGPMC